MPHRLKLIATTKELPPDVIECDDPEYDETLFDFSDPEEVIITQTDEHGRTHTVVLSPRMIAQVNLRMFQWKSSNDI